MTERDLDRSASRFVEQWVPRLRHRLGDRSCALDLACGAGRHARLLAMAGFETFAVDVSETRVSRIRSHATTSRPIHAWVADLERIELPVERFHLVLGTNYLQRSLWPSMKRAVTLGGFLVYETFTVAQLARGVGPRSIDHLLQPGELRDVVPGWAIEWYQEVDAPVATAQLVARKPA